MSLIDLSSRLDIDADPNKKIHSYARLKETYIYW